MSRLQDGNFDKPFSKEQKKEPIKIQAGCVENIGVNGIDRGNDQNNGLWLFIDTVKKKFDFTQVSDADAQNGRTSRVLLVAVETIDRSSYAEIPKGIMDSLLGNAVQTKPQKSKYGNWQKGDVAILFTYRAKDVAGQGEDGQLSGAAVLNRTDALSLYKEMSSDPTALFRLVTMINKGPVKQKDGSPAEISAGEKITFLPNKVFGGTLEKSAESLSFLKGFNPNLA